MSRPPTYPTKFFGSELGAVRHVADVRVSTYTVSLKIRRRRTKSRKRGHAEAHGETNGNAGAGENDKAYYCKTEALELNLESRLADERWSPDTSAEAVKAEWLRLLPGVAGLELAGGGEDESEG
jgi:hypothetical protein